MAKKPIAVQQPQDLYEMVEKFLIEDLNAGGLVGRWLCGNPFARAQNVAVAEKFNSYEEAKDFIATNMLEGVGIVKVYL